MVPKIADGGASFIGAGVYYLGPGRSGVLEEAIGGIADYMLGAGRTEVELSGGRVGFVRLLNLSVASPVEAFASMQATFERYQELKRGAKGRPLTEPVYSFSLSWAVGQYPADEEMIRAATEVLALLGMEGHQAVFVSHVDKPYDHVHVIVNRIKPDMSGVASKSMDRLKLSRWAESYELNEGMIRCVERVRNNALRREGFITKDLKSKSRQEIEAERRGAWPALNRLYGQEQEVINRCQRLGDNPHLRKHTQELERHFANINGRARAEYQVVLERFRPAFARSYQEQKRRLSEVTRAGTSRHTVSDYVDRNIHWLGVDGSLAQETCDVISVSQDALKSHIAQIGASERKLIGRQQKAELEKVVQTVWEDAHLSVQKLLRRQELEIAGEGPAKAEQTAAPEEEAAWSSPYELPTAPVPDLVRRLNVSERGAKRLIEERRAVRAAVTKHEVKLRQSGRDVVVTVPSEFKKIVTRRQLRDPAEFERWLLELLREHSKSWQRRQKMLRDKELLQEARSLRFDMVSRQELPRAALQVLGQAAADFKDALECLRLLLDEQQKRLDNDFGAKTWITGFVQQVRVNWREREPNDLIARCTEQCVRCYKALSEAIDKVFTAFKSFVGDITLFHHGWKRV